MCGSINEAMHPIVMCGLMYMYVVITENSTSLNIHVHDMYIVHVNGFAVPAGVRLCVRFSFTLLSYLTYV